MLPTKSLIFCLAAFFTFNQWTQAQTILTLNQLGKPNYLKLLPNHLNRAYIVYKNESNSFFRMLPNEVWDLTRDTLQFSVNKEKGSNFSVVCNNCNDIAFTTTRKNDSTYLEFSNGQRKITYLAFLEREVHESAGAAPVVSWTKDTLLGFIRMRNTFTRYATIPNERGINLAVMDLDKNGIYNENDLISLSRDEYFLTTEKGSSAGLIKSIDRMLINNTVYDIKLLDQYIPTFSIQVSKEKTYDIALTDTLPNFELSGTSLFDELNNHDYVLFSYFSENCMPCIHAIPELNMMPTKIKVIGLYGGNNTLSSVQNKCNIQFPLDLGKDIIGHFQLNGFPNYVLINSKHEIVYQGGSLKEILALINP